MDRTMKEGTSDPWVFTWELDPVVEDDRGRLEDDRMTTFADTDLQWRQEEEKEGRT